MRNDCPATMAAALTLADVSRRSTSSITPRSSTILSLTSPAGALLLTIWRTSANSDSASMVRLGSITRSGISTASKWFR